MSKTLVVGANRGIGLELARRYAARGDEVIATCRASSGELDSLAVEVVRGVEVTTDAGVAALRAALGDRVLDVAVVVSGILRGDDLEHLDLDRVREQIEVNAIGPLRVARALVAHLGKGSKLAFLTSRMGSIADNSSGGYYAYRMSKAALNMAGASLAIDLRGRGVAVALVHPGFVRTEMTGGNGNVDPLEAAAEIVERIDALTLASSGQFVHANGERLPW